MRVAVFGHGNVGGALARSLRKAGHEVVIASERVSEEARAWIGQAGASVAAPGEAIESSDVVILAIPFAAVEEALAPLRDSLRGKVVVDCTNPVGPGLRHGLGSVTSGSETIQSLLPGSQVVKAFSVYGFENLEDADFGAVTPAMPYCGDDPGAKAAVAGLVRDLGWEPVDVGPLSQALHLEHMTLLWIAMVRVGGGNVRTVWARLEGMGPA